MPVGLAALLLLSALAACNAILGVGNVTLQRDAGAADHDYIDDPFDSDFFDPLPDPDGGPVNRPNLLQVALGDQHTCARKPDGTVKCWGDALQGQIGSGEGSDGGIVSTAAKVATIEDAIDIAAGRNHTCVVRYGGTVSCWGYNLDGQLGNGESANVRDTPVDVANLTGAVSVAAGGNFSCAVRSGGTVACWGGNGSGQLGPGGGSGATTPIVVPGLEGVVSMSAGEAHACAVKNDGSVLCWGDGQNGQLGSGSPTSSPTPAVVDQLPEALVVAAAERSTCALSKTNMVYCWGANELGQLGNGAANSTPNPRPIVVANLADATALSAGKNHVCAVRKTGEVACWGDGLRGQLGDGKGHDGGLPQASLVMVSGIQSAFAVGGGGEHSCAVTRASAISCWGANDRGQLGNGSSGPDTMETAPVPVTGYP
jgi:hypothetical protein